MRQDGFYVRRGDPLWPIYEVRGDTIRVVASRIGGLDHEYRRQGRSLPSDFVKAGATLREAHMFAPKFYAQHSHALDASGDVRKSQRA